MSSALAFLAISPFLTPQEHPFEVESASATKSLYAGRYDEAIATWEQHLDAWPPDATLARKLALAHLWKGDQDGAIEWLREAAESGVDLYHEVSRHDAWVAVREDPRFPPLKAALKEAHERLTVEFRPCQSRAASRAPSGEGPPRG